jgi:flagellar hook-associated protein 1 FlgK
MSLSAALRTAQSSLMATALQTSISSRNIANAGDPTYSRKIALTTTTLDGGAQVVTIRRAADQALLSKMFSATSSAASQQALLASLTTLANTVGDPEKEHSAAAQLSGLGIAIQQYAVSPADPILAQGVLTKANELAGALNAATDVVQQARAQADADIGLVVANVNDLLKKFEELNTTIVKGSQAGSDMTDELDQRDAILAKLSEEMGIRTISRANNDVVIYTDGGVTLFETTARAVTFEPRGPFSAATIGNAVKVDGIPVTGDAATMPLSSGRIKGLATVRDEAAVSYQSQLDEVARGLIEAFAESDQSVPPALPDAPGLFTYSGAPAMPATGALIVGLAGEISVNPAVDPDQGGSIALIRDGGINGPSYRYNPTAAASFSDRLQGYLDALAAERPFDPAAGLGAAATLSEFAASSVSWLEAARQNATTSSDYQTTLLERTSAALSNVTGVNLDDEMANLMELERSYQASSKLIAAVDGMFGSLLQAVG